MKLSVPESSLFFLSSSEEVAMSLNGLNYLSLLLIHDGTCIFWMSISVHLSHSLSGLSVYGLHELPSSP